MTKNEIKGKGRQKNKVCKLAIANSNSRVEMDLNCQRLPLLVTTN